MERQRPQRRPLPRRLWLLPLLSFLAGGLLGSSGLWRPATPAQVSQAVALEPPPRFTPQGWPILDPLPTPQEIWECEVAIIGGTLGGIAAAAHAMQGGSQTCLIELTPWLGGQISSQGVSALDESLVMRRHRRYAPSWAQFKRLIEQQPVHLPPWTGVKGSRLVWQLNSCWVGFLCFPPDVGARAAEQLLQQRLPQAPGSRWSTGTAFKGAEFDPSGRLITAIYAVQRLPKDPSYAPLGRFSREFAAWYRWSEDETFRKIPIRLQAPPGKTMLVIDATDTGELVGWAGIPHRLGTESRQTSGEPHGAPFDNPECTQAFTYPFVLAIKDDQGRSLAALADLQTGYSKAEHRRAFDMEGFPMFSGQSFFHYRRMVSLTRNDPFTGTPARGDMTLVNWNRGNDWGIMNPPLLMTLEQLESAGQQQNWQGGMHFNALKDGENHALLFAEWLMQTQARPGFPLALITGPEGPMGTHSGLSMVPYIREGRRILGRAAYGETAFQIREQDIRRDKAGGRDFRATAVGVTHYAIDIHGCRYRNWEPSGSANSAPKSELYVDPIYIPLEALIPQRLDNLLIGGKGIAVTSIVNAATRVHHGEWTIGSAAGAVAAWLRQRPNLTPAEIVPGGHMAALQRYLVAQGLRLEW
ncbi:MAG: FAD-dependent oxidoreductase [Thermostichales cyanobacterium SZTDM-1c_bins_54]